MTVEATIFDMDGVLVDTERLYEQIEKEVCVQFGLSVPDSEFPGFKGMTNQAIFSHVIKRYGSASLLVNDMISAKRQMLQDVDPSLIQPIPGALEFIGRSRERFGQIALTTSSRRSWQKAVFKAVCMPNVFDVIVTGDDIPEGKGKPHPYPYTVTSELLGVCPEQCMVFEDSCNGIVSAVGAGCEVTGITTSFPKDELISAGAHRTIDRFDEFELM